MKLYWVLVFVGSFVAEELGFCLARAAESHRSESQRSHREDQIEITLYLKLVPLMVAQTEPPISRVQGEEAAHEVRQFSIEGYRVTMIPITFSWHNEASKALVTDVSPVLVERPLPSIGQEIYLHASSGSMVLVEESGLQRDFDEALTDYAKLFVDSGQALMALLQSSRTSPHLMRFASSVEESLVSSTGGCERAPNSLRLSSYEPEITCWLDIVYSRVLSF